MPLHPPTVNDTTITITPSVTRTTALDAVNHRIGTIDPTSNLAGATSYTVTMTTGLGIIWALDCDTYSNGFDRFHYGINRRIRQQMSFQDHLETCSYCRKDSQKVIVSIKSASSYYREKKLAQLGAVNRGISYPGISYAGIKKTNEIIRTKTKAMGTSSMDVKAAKLRELGKMIKGLQDKN